MIVDTKPEDIVGVKLDENGVVLLKQVIPDSIVTSVKGEYDILDQKLTRTDIARDRPLIVFWNHVMSTTHLMASSHSKTVPLRR